MSIVLYALGAGLMGWGAYLMLAGESYAAIDIAASLAGWGAFTIGLGALVAALHKLTRTVVQSRRAGQDTPARTLRQGGKARKDKAGQGNAGKRKPGQEKINREKGGKEKVLPIFVPAASDGPAHFEPSKPEAPAKLEPAAKPLVAAAPTPEASPAAEARPEPILAPPPPPVPPVASPARRGMRLGLRRPQLPRVDDDQIEAPPVASAALGGGLGLRKARDEAPALPAQPIVPPATPEPAVAPPLEATGSPKVTAAPNLGLDPGLVQGPNPTDDANSDDAKSDDAKSAPEAESPQPDLSASVSKERPIMPIRRPVSEGPPVALREPDAPPSDAAFEPVASESDAPNEPEIVTEQTDPQIPPADEQSGIAPESASAPAPEIQAVEERAPVPQPDDQSAPDSPPVAVPVRAAAPDPKVPDWLARARARRQARIHDEVRIEPEISEPRFVGSAPKAPETPAPAEEAAPEPVVTAEQPDAAPSEDDASERRIVSEGEHNGVLYRFFDDGSVEAVSPHGVRRFASVDDLKQAVISARGPDYQGPDGELAGGVLEPALEQRSDRDPLDDALAELEGGPAPEVRLDPDDRLGPGLRR